MIETVEAAVRVGRTETTYVRAGHGLPVLLLTEGGPRGIAREGAFRRLARDFLVVAPALPRPALDGGDAARWLRDLLDGLGLDRPLLAVRKDVAGTVSAFLALERDRLAGVAIYDGMEGDAALDVLVASLRRAAEPHPPPG